MLNQVILVGRLVKTPELFVAETGNKGSIITLAVGRAFKNQDGEYDTDFLDCTLWTGIAENTAEYCRKGDVIGVRGRLQSRIVEKEDGKKKKKMEVIAEKVTFLSTGKPSDKEDDNGSMNQVENVCDDNLQDVKESKNKKNK